MSHFIRVFSLAGLLLAAQISNAQTKSTGNGGNGNERPRLDLTIGPALPIGGFGSKDPSNDNAGFAKLGASASLSFDLPLKNSLYGLTASLRARWNPVNGHDIIEPLKEQTTGIDWQDEQTKKMSWQAGALMVGAYRIFKLPGKIRLEGALMAGVARAASPHLQAAIIGVSSANQIDLMVIEVKKVNSTAFTAAARFGALMPISRKLDLIARLDYWYLDPTFKNLTQSVALAQGMNIPGNYSLPNGQSVSYNQHTSNESQHMPSQSLELGVGYRL